MPVRGGLWVRVLKNSRDPPHPALQEEKKRKEKKKKKKKKKKP
jgi:hypothetical protein